MFRIENAAERATVYLYGTIGEDFWTPEESNTAREFAQTLDGLSPKPLDIRIDSGGGDVYEGFAIASAIQRYEGETCAYIDGLAASAASYIALMADRVVMNDYAELMIHKAWTYTQGNADGLRALAERLDAVDSNIAGIISARSGLSMDEAEAAMAAETWYRGLDALEAGLCDEVIETGQRIAASIDRRIAARYRNVPQNVRLVEEERFCADVSTALPPITMECATRSADSGKSASHAESNVTPSESGLVAAFGNRLYRMEDKQCR